MATCIVQGTGTGGGQSSIDNSGLMLDYSEEEQETGRHWLDGRMIYSKSITFQGWPEYNNGGKPIGGGLAVQAGIGYVLDAEEVEAVIGCEKVCYSIDGQQFVDVYGKFDFSFDWDEDGIYIFILPISPHNVMDFDGCITFYYIKHPE